MSCIFFQAEIQINEGYWTKVGNPVKTEKDADALLEEHYNNPKIKATRVVQLGCNDVPNKRQRCCGK